MTLILKLYMPIGFNFKDIFLICLSRLINIVLPRLTNGDTCIYNKCLTMVPKFSYI